MITQLNDNEIFVFGSNTAGLHRGGAAKQAADEFSAERGIGEGLTGKCYAFPTLDGNLNQRPKEELELSRNLLYHTCDKNRGKQFLLTKVGCGIAGYPESDMRELFNNPPTNLVLPNDWPVSTVLVMRTCNANLRSEHEAAKGFQWPKSGYVAAPDWNPTEKCGGGLHGLLWGEGDSNLLNHSPTAKALVVRVTEDDIVHLDGKVKFPSGHVVFCGTRHQAAAFIQNNGGQGKATHYGTATAGNRGTATAGDYGTATARDYGTATARDYGTATAGDDGTATAGDFGTATAGDFGTATAGDYGTATAGYRGTATAGDFGTATAGDYGTINIKYWDGNGYRIATGYIGENNLLPNTPYKLNDKHQFTPAKEKD